MIIYTCPKCGSQLNHYCVATFPPIHVYRCSNPDCNWETEEDEGIEYHVFKPVKAKLDEDWTMYENIENVMLND